MHRASDIGSQQGHSQASSPSSPASGGGSAPQPVDVNAEGHVCPFCGLIREITEDFDASSPCPRCTLADTPTTRNATKARIGPWHVRQMRNPWAPGMRWETLLALIKRGQVTKDSIVRGPTTHQLWRRASEIKGLSREFGLCYSCGGEIDTQSNLCPHCNRLQEPPVNPNVLVETREFAQQQSAAVAAQQQQQAAAANASAKAHATRPAASADQANGNGFDDAPHIDIGASTPPVGAVDPDEMLTVDDPEQAAAMARAITSRAPTKPPRVPAPKQMEKTGPGLPPPATTTSEKSRASQQPQAPAVAPRESRPIPLRPRPAGTEDALLTPQELAAAFQLNFTPSESSDGASGGVTAPPAAPSFPIEGDFFPPSQRPSGKRSKLLVAFVLLLLVAVGAAVLGYLRPDLRERAATWSQQKYESARQFVTSRTSPAKPTLEPVPTPPQSPRPSDVGPSGRAPAATRPQPIVIAPRIPNHPEPVDESPATTPTVAPAPIPASQETTVIETPQPPRPAPETPAGEATGASAKAPMPTPPPVPPPAVEPKPAASAPAVAVVASPTKVWTNMSDAEDEARRLWRAAFDAEQNQDYVEAVNCYEAIKKLPAEVQPRGLDVRLSLAKKLTK